VFRRERIFATRNKNRAWDTVQDCWSTRPTADGETELVAKRIKVVYGIEYNEDDDDDDDDDDNNDDNNYDNE
jgi:hypothetical protein